MIYVNYNAYLVGSDLEKKKINIDLATDPSILMNKMKERVTEFYNPNKHWNQPCSVLKKASKHTCYTMSSLLDWR